MSLSVGVLQIVVLVVSAQAMSASSDPSVQSYYDAFSNTTGNSFTEDFSLMSEQLWIVDHAFISCLRSSTECIYITEENVRLMHRRQPVNHMNGFNHKLVLSLRNDCRSHQCCDLQDNGTFYCTPWTAAQVTSKHPYLYGTFRFHVRMTTIMHALNLTEDVNSCITFE